MTSIWEGVLFWNDLACNLLISTVCPLTSVVCAHFCCEQQAEAVLALLMKGSSWAIKDYTSLSAWCVAWEGWSVSECYKWYLTSCL